MTELIYTKINEKIRESIEKVDRIKEIYSYPATDIRAYPSVVFYPSDFNNIFQTNEENFQTKGYKMFIIVSGEQKDKETIFDTILAKSVDSVINQLAEDWDIGTIDGHRAWLQIEGGNWGMGQEQNGIEAWAEFNLTIKLLTNNN